MKYYITILFLLLFIFSCNNNYNNDEEIIDNIENTENIEDYKDFFSNKEITFKRLELVNNSTNDNKYYITNVEASFSPPINSVRLSEEEKNIVIEQTGYFKDYFYTESLFVDERIMATCLVGYMEREAEKLDAFITSLRNMKKDNNIKDLTEEYYTIKGKKNIQFRININDASYWFYVIFEANNGYYLILNYTFPISYLADSVDRIANSLNSITF
mgnify:CR=1 FL=1